MRINTFIKTILLLLFQSYYFIYCQIGKFDSSYNIGIGVNGLIYSMAIQPDDKIIISGNFTTYNGFVTRKLVRLNTDGTIDNSLVLDPNYYYDLPGNYPIQTDGKFFVNRTQISNNGTSFRRLNPNGSVDSSFIPDPKVEPLIGTTKISNINVFPNGKIMVGGTLAEVSSNPYIYTYSLVQLHPNGSYDPSFQFAGAPAGVGGSFMLQSNNNDFFFNSYTINTAGTGLDCKLGKSKLIGSSSFTYKPFGFGSAASVVTLSNGKYLIGGNFTNYNNQINKNYLLVIDSIGQIDSTQLVNINGPINMIVQQNDGKFLVSGQFSSYNNTSVSNFIRLNNDLSLDSTFITSFDNQVKKFVVQNDGKIVAGGYFLHYDTIACEGIARIQAAKGVIGNLYNDLNFNCSKENIENKVSSSFLSIQPGNIIIQAKNGIWSIDSLPIGTYTATVDTFGQWKATCLPSTTFNIINPDSIVLANNIGIAKLNPCTEPEISIFAPFLRRCFSNQFIYLQAFNLSTASQVLYNSYADVKLDSFLTIDSSTIPYISLGNYTYRFQLDSIYPGQTKSWKISTTVSCDANLGQTLCLQADLFPIADCVLDSTPNVVTGVSPCIGPWDQSSLGVEGECVGDSIRFVISNHGVFGNGDMDCYLPIRIYVDGVLTTLDSLKIVGGDSLVIMIPGDGRTWRLETDQHPLHPGNSHPNATIEACGDSALVATNWTPGLVTTMPQNDADPVVDIYCSQVMGAYDPNDKTGYPLGTHTEHFILPNQQIQYVIRFQNTGTDTAFKVIIRDTLETDLNIFTVVSGVSSHNYSFRMYGPRILEWTFNNIMLPDSFINELNSHGFVTFTVEQNRNLPSGTFIDNSAAIYFDFNSPVITNVAHHEINDNINKLPVSIDKSQNITDIKVFPNPNNGFFKVELPIGMNKITICNVMGQVVHVETLHATSLHEIDLSKQPNGIYFLKVENGEMEWNKKVVKN